MQPLRSTPARAVLVLSLLSGSLAHANAIVLEFTGGTPAIPGYSTIKGFEKKIDVSSFQWGVGVAIDRAGGRAVTSSPSFSDISWGQSFDANYNAMSQALVRAEDYDKSKFSFLRVDSKGDRVSRLEIETGQAAFSALSFSSGGASPVVSASQTYRTIELTYKPESLTIGKFGAAITAKYDTVAAAGSGAPGNLSVSGLGDGSLNGGRTGAGGIYLSMTGVKGESQADGYKNWTELSSMQMGMGIALTPRSSGPGFLTAKPSLSELTISQSFDQSVIGSLGALFESKKIDEARLELVENTRRGSVTTMELKLKDVFISGVTLSSGGDLPTVTQSLNFGSYTQTIWDIDTATGLRGGGSKFTYDALNNLSSYSTFIAPGAGAAGGGGLPDTSASMGAPPESIAAIPEPHTWALMSGGIAMLLMWSRRRGLKPVAATAAG